MVQRGEKKDRIAALLQADYSISDIAAEVGTSVSYVMKTKSILKKEGKLRASRIRDKNEIVELSLLPNTTLQDASKLDKKAKSEQDELDAEVYRKIYTEFEKGTKPSTIIANTGFSPSLVEREYERYVRLIGLDMNDFRKRMLGFLGGAFKRTIAKDIIPILEKETTSDELFGAVKALCFTCINYGIRHSIDNPYGHLPAGWKRLACRKCGLPVGGAIIDSRTGLGESLERFLISVEGNVHCMCDEQTTDFRKDYVLQVIRDAAPVAKKVEKAIETLADPTVIDGSAKNK